MRGGSRLGIAFWLVGFFASALSAQHFSMPGPSSAPPVLCTTCTGSSYNKPTASYGPPLTRFAGRFIDSSTTKDVQANVRTYRARGGAIVPERDRVYMIIGGSTFASYRLSTFFTSDLGQPLVQVNNSRVADPETYLPFFSKVDPDNDSSWQIVFVDGQYRLDDFDWDDRGYCYLAYREYGWGIVRDNPSGFSFVSQVTADNPNTIVTVRVGSSYYASTYFPGYWNSTYVYDVTVPSTPVFIRNVPLQANDVRKAYSGGDVVAALTPDYKLKIYSPTAFSQTGVPEKTFTSSDGNFTALTTDGTNFYAFSTGAGTSIAIFRPSSPGSASSYAVTYYPISAPFTLKSGGMQWGPGYLTINGYISGTSQIDLFVYPLTDGAPGSSPLNLNSFFKDYYTNPPSTNAVCSYCKDPVPTPLRHSGSFTYAYGGKTYLLNFGWGLGDVFELAGGSSTPVAPDPSIGVSGCSYVADSCTLSVSSLSGQSQSGWTYQWQLDGVNTETTPTYSPSLSAGSHVIGLTATSSIGSGTASRTLNVLSAPPPPDPIIGVSGCGIEGGPCTFSAVSASGQSRTSWSYQWSLDSSPSGTGETFSPGLTAGSHTVDLIVTSPYGTGTASKTVSVAPPGSCPTSQPSGSLDVSFSGPTSGCNTNPTSPPCKVGENIKFQAAIFLYSLQACDSVTWDFGDGQSGSGKTAYHTYSSSGTRTVRVTISNSLGSLQASRAVPVGTSTPAVPVATISASTTSALINSSISFTGSATNGPITGWNWTFGDGTTATGQAVTHSWSSAGVYQVTLVATNSAGSSSPASRSITISNSSTCGQDPASIPLDMTFLGSSSGCTPSSGTCQPGESIRFYASAFGYNFQACDLLTWDFGDGQSGTGKTVEHTYSTGGTRNISLTLSNSYGSKRVTRPLTVAGSGGQPPTNVDFTYTPNNPVAGVPVTFTGSATSTAAVTYTWNFGDGQTATGATATHTFANPSSYLVELRAVNDYGAGAVKSTLITVAESNNFAFLLPVVAHLDNPDGTKWQTDLQIFHATPGDLTLDLEFRSAAQTIRKQLVVTGSTLITEDLGRFFAATLNDKGSVTVRGNSSTPPQMWTRTYIISSNGVGTFGQLIPAVELETTSASAAAGEGSKQYIAGLLSTAKYRSNLGLVNPTATTASVTIQLIDQETGTALGNPINRSVDAFGFAQINDSELRSLVPQLEGRQAPYAVNVTRPNGDAIIGYGSIVNQVSNDPVYVQSIAESDATSESRRSQLLPGLARFSTPPTSENPAGDKWRSDVSIFNPDPAEVAFDLELYDLTGNQVARVPNWKLGSMKGMELDDVLSNSMFGSLSSTQVTMKVVTSTAGTVHYPIVFSRTYNDQDDRGVFGQGIPAFAFASANVQSTAGSVAYIPGVRSDTRYYTNLGLVSASDMTTVVKVTLLDGTTGQPVGNAQSFTVGRGESKIVGSLSSDFIHSLEPNAQIGTLKIEILSGGNVWAFASIIDKTTKDPEYVPAVPVP